MGETKELPLGQRLRHGEFELHPSFAVGEQMRKEEGRFVEVLACRDLAQVGPRTVRPPPALSSPAMPAFPLRFAFPASRLHGIGGQGTVICPHRVALPRSSTATVPRAARGGHRAAAAMRSLYPPNIHSLALFAPNIRIPTGWP